MQHEVGIVGGGITGLSAAYYLQEAGVKSVGLLEKSDRLGGKIQTIKEKGYLIDAGPDSFVTQKLEALQLIQALGMADEVILPNTSQFYFLKGGELIPAPEGMRMLVPTDLEKFLASPLFSLAGKERILDEVNIPAIVSEEGDESFAEFIQRRFGEEMLQNYAGPLFNGIYATSPEELSLRATFPAFLAAEKKFGSLTAASQSAGNQSSENRSPFVSLKNGMGSLVDQLVNALDGTDIQLSTDVSQVQKERDGYLLLTSKGVIRCKKLVLTLPAKISAHLLSTILPEAANELREFTVSSSRILTFAFRKDDVAHLPKATGYIKTFGQKGVVSASTWTSEKWLGRAPEGVFLGRFFVGHQDVTDNIENITTKVLAEIQSTLGIDAAPLRSWLHDWPSQLPQYKLGHLEKIERVTQALEKEGLLIAGCAFGGVGIPDCIRQGKEAAHKLLS